MGSRRIYGDLVVSGKIICDDVENHAGVATTTATDSELSGNLTVAGTTELTWLLTVNGGISADGGVFEVANTSGNVVTTGTLAVTGASTLTGNVSCGGTLDTTGAATLASATVTGALAADGGITCDTNAFTVADTSGNTAIAGTLTVTGATVLNGGLTMDTNKFTVADTSGNTAVGGTLAVTGATTLTGLINANGGIAVDTTAFTVADTSGNTAIAGTLTVTGATVMNGGITCDTDKFTVADTSGNTVVGGTLGVTGASTLTGLLNANGGIAVDTSAFTVADTTGAVACGDIQCKGGDIDAGLSGTAGSVDIFASTAASGKLAITCTDQTGDTTVSLVAGAMGAARTITLRDPGAAASILTTTDATAAATEATAAEITRACDVSARKVSLTGTAAITEALHEGKVCVITGTGAAYTYTLPEATGSGATYRFVMNQVNTSNTIFTTADATNCGFYGSVNILDLDAAAQAAYAPAATDEIMTLNGTTTGGAIGDYIQFIDMATDKWCVFAQLQCPTGSNPATPFSGA